MNIQTRRFLLNHWICKLTLCLYSTKSFYAWKTGALWFMLLWNMCSCFDVAPYFSYLICGSLERRAPGTNGEHLRYLKLNSAFIFHNVKTCPPLLTEPACLFSCFTTLNSNAPLLSSLFYSLAVRKVLCPILWYLWESLLNVIYMNLMCVVSAFSVCRKMFLDDKLCFTCLKSCFIMMLWPSAESPSAYSEHKYSRNCLMMRCWLKYLLLMRTFDVYRLPSIQHSKAFVGRRSNNNKCAAAFDILLNRYNHPTTWTESCLGKEQFIDLDKSESHSRSSSWANSSFSSKFTERRI